MHVNWRNSSHNNVSIGLLYMEPKWWLDHQTFLLTMTLIVGVLLIPPIPHGRSGGNYFYLQAPLHWQSMACGPSQWTPGPHSTDLTTPVPDQCTPQTGGHFTRASVIPIPDWTPLSSACRHCGGTVDNLSPTCHPRLINSHQHSFFICTGQTADLPKDQAIGPVNRE